MSVQAIGAPVQAARPRTRLRLEHFVMGGAILCLIVLVVLPLMSLLIGSLRGEQGLSLDNFKEVASGRLYVNALKNSLILGAWTGLFSLILGVALAWAVSRTDVPGKALMQVTASLSYLSPPFLTAIAFVYLFSPNAGLINVVVRDVLGLPFLTFNIFSMTGLVMVTVLHTFPFVYLLASSALAVGRCVLRGSRANSRREQVPHRADRDGAAGRAGDPLRHAARLRQRHRAVRLAGDHRPAGTDRDAADPHLCAVRLSAGIWPRFGDVAAVRRHHRGGALSAARVPGAALLRDARRQRRAAATDAARTVALGGVRLRGAGLHRRDRAALCDADRGVAVEVLGARLLEGADAQELHFILFEYNVTQRAILNSLGLATVAATIAVLLGAIIGWIDLRTRIPGRKLLDYAALIPLGLPGIVVAVALIQFWLAMPFALCTERLAILLLAYVGRYIPLGVRAANSSLRQIDPSLEESAQILGASWLTTMREVTLPLIRPGLFAGWLLVFVPVIQELSASILLFSSSSITLAVAVYNLYETGYIEPVAALAMINMVIIGAAIFVANKLGGGRIASRSGATQGLAS